MDGNSAKKAPILDHLVDTSSAKTSNKSSSPNQKKGPKLPLWAAARKTVSLKTPDSQNNNAVKSDKNATPSPSIPQNRRIDKSKFEIELTETVNKIMAKHFENASEEIVQQVLEEVRARLPGQRKP